MEDYGVRYGVSRNHERVLWWFFDKDRACDYARKCKQDTSDVRVIRGQLVNDEGCSPYIVWRETVVEAEDLEN